MREKLEFGQKPTLPSARFYEVFQQLQNPVFAGRFNIGREYEELKQDYPEYAQAMDDISNIWSRYLKLTFITYTRKHLTLGDLNLRRLGLAGAILLERLYPEDLPVELTRSGKKRIEEEQIRLEGETSEYIPNGSSLGDSDKIIIEKIMLGDLKIIPAPEPFQQLILGLKKGTAVIWGFNSRS